MTRDSASFPNRSSTNARRDLRTAPLTRCTDSSVSSKRETQGTACLPPTVDDTPVPSDSQLPARPLGDPPILADVVDDQRRSHRVKLPALSHSRRDPGPVLDH